jgi:hypothetical protein
MISRRVSLNGLLVGGKEYYSHGLMPFVGEAVEVRIPDETVPLIDVYSPSGALIVAALTASSFEEGSEHQGKLSCDQ